MSTNDPALDEPHAAAHEPEPVSKTRRKQAMHDLQAMGERLAALPPECWQELPLSDRLRAALEQARCIRSHEARRRQLQYIGKLMRTEDTAAILLVLQQEARTASRSAQQLHALERWRAELIEPDNAAIDRLLARYPQIDSAALRPLIAAARSEQATGKPRGAGRALFRHLATIVKAP